MELLKNFFRRDVGWMTRAIAFVVVTFTIFCEVLLHSQTPLYHRMFTCAWTGLFWGINGYTLLLLYYRNGNEVPQMCTLSEAFKSEGPGLIGWITDHLIPMRLASVHWEGRRILIWNVILFVTSAMYYFVAGDGYIRPEPVSTPIDFVGWAIENWRLLIGIGTIFLTLLSFIIVSGIVATFKAWHFAKYVNPHVVALGSAQEQHKATSDNWAKAHQQWDAAYKSLKADLESEKANRVVQVESLKRQMMEDGYHLACVFQMLTRIPKKRGDGKNLKRAIDMVEGVFKSLMPNEKDRYAALYQAGAYLDDPSVSSIDIPVPPST